MNRDRMQINNCPKNSMEREGMKEVYKEHEEILGGNGYVYYLVHGHGFKGVFMCQNLSNFTLNMCSVLDSITSQ